MSNNPNDAPRQLPADPNLRHLKDQARDLLKAGSAASITDAQFQIARIYGFSSWPKLKAHVDSRKEIGQLKEAIDANDIERVRILMTRNPTLHRAPLGYGESGPLTWVAECRIPWGPPSPARLAMAKWMIENGSDVHQGVDAPLMRAALNAQRIPMMELLLSYGADVNAQWQGHFPIIFASCEAVDPVPLKWLLEHGADPNRGNQRWANTALDYLICAYARSSQFPACIDLILAAGGKTKYDAPEVLELLRGRIGRLKELLDADPDLVSRRYPELDCGQTGARNLLLRGATLLHVAAEYGNLEAAKLLLDRGAQVNAQAAIDENGIGGQPPIFHAVTQFNDWGLPVAQLLLEHGADLSIRVKLPGEYERPDEVVECTPLGYAIRFPGGETRTVMLLREHDAIE